MRLKNFLNEKIQKVGLGITFVDIDETLFNTFAKINVVKDGKIIKQLSNSEYNEYKKKEGESFDFSEFRSSKLFYNTSKPIKKMIDKISIIVDRAEKKGSKVILLTARANFDDKNIFLDTFRKSGFPIDKVYVERAGNSNEPNIPLAKKNIILNYLKGGKYTRVRLFDDYLATCKEFIKIKNDLSPILLDRIRKNYDLYDIPEDDLISFESFQVQKDGSVKRIK